MMAKSYNWILEEYPEYITKDQFYRICHVSKKTALYYLESGLIPCVDSGKRTRRFTIATKDVVDFLNKRDNDPQACKPIAGWYAAKRKRLSTSQPFCKETQESLAVKLDGYPDLLKSRDVAQITGYSDTAVVTWCSSGKLHGFLIRRTYLIPKASLIEFMLSNTFNGIK